MIRYFRSDLQHKSDLLFRGPFGGAYPAPTTANGDWMSTNWAAGPQPTGVPAYAPGFAPPGSSQESPPLVSPLRRAMELNPSLRVGVMTGMYDNAAPAIGCDYVAYSISRVDPKLRDRITALPYVGGHMMYTDKLARQGMRRDVAELVRAATAAKSTAR